MFFVFLPIHTDVKTHKSVGFSKEKRGRPLLSEKMSSNWHFLHQFIHFFFQYGSGNCADDAVCHLTVFEENHVRHAHNTVFLCQIHSLVNVDVYKRQVCTCMTWYSVCTTASSATKA